LREAVVQCRNRHWVSGRVWKRLLNTQVDQCMLPAKVYGLRFFEDPKKPLDMLRTSDPLSLLNEHT
jgi:hypothetical protein